MDRKRMELKNGKKRNRLWAIAAVMMITVVISACGSSKTDTYNTAAGAPAAVMEEIAYEDSMAYDTASYDGGMAISNEAAKSAYQYEAAEAAAEEPLSESQVEGGSGQEVPATTGRKLIKTVNISAETEDFDALVPNLQKQVEALGGYIESISVYDVGSYYVEEQQVKQRCANLTARVPKEKLDGFLVQVGEQTNVTSRSENVEDVTLHTSKLHPQPYHLNLNDCYFLCSPK